MVVGRKHLAFSPQPSGHCPHGCEPRPINHHHTRLVHNFLEPRGLQIAPRRWALEDTLIVHHPHDSKGQRLAVHNHSQSFTLQHLVNNRQGFNLLPTINYPLRSGPHLIINSPLAYNLSLPASNTAPPTAHHCQNPKPHPTPYHPSQTSKPQPPPAH